MADSCQATPCWLLRFCGSFVLLRASHTALWQHANPGSQDVEEKAFHRNAEHDKTSYENTVMGWALREVPEAGGTYRELANGNAEVCQRSSDHAKLGSLKNAAWARHGGTHL